jgi:hypothetical protein
MSHVCIVGTTVCPDDGVLQQGLGAPRSELSAAEQKKKAADYCRKNSQDQDPGLTNPTASLCCTFGRTRAYVQRPLEDDML